MSPQLLRPLPTNTYFLIYLLFLKLHTIRHHSIRLEFTVTTETDRKGDFRRGDNQRFFLHNNFSRLDIPHGDEESTQPLIFRHLPPTTVPLVILPVQLLMLFRTIADFLAAAASRHGGDGTIVNTTFEVVLVRVVL